MVLTNNGISKTMDKKKLNTISKSKFVNNLLYIIKSKDRYFNLNRKNIDIVELIESNIDLIDEYALEKDILLIFDTNVEKYFINADVNEVNNVIINIISNYISLLPLHKKIYIFLCKGKNSISISIKGKGLCIAFEEQRNIFNKFIESEKYKNSSIKMKGIDFNLVKSVSNIKSVDIDNCEECKIVIRNME